MIGFIDELAYKKNVDKLVLFIDEIKENYLKDNKGDDKN